LLVNGDSKIKFNLLILFGVENQFEEDLFVLFKYMLRNIITTYASIQSEKFSHLSSKRVWLPVIISPAECAFEVLFELVSEVPEKLLHEGISPERALSIKMLHDFKSCCLWTGRWKVHRCLSICKV
jgi:hypothetical protein